MSENTHSSFMKSIFQGALEDSKLHNYPFFTTPKEDDFKMMHSAVDKWLKDVVDAEKFDEEKKLPDDLMQGLKEMGLFGLIIPEEFGGSEFSQTFYTRFLELTNHFTTSISLTIGAHASIGLKGLYLYGNDEQKAKYMPKLATGEMIAAFALTEPGAGSDAAGIKTRVVREGDHYILNGTKLWITNGRFADFFTVFAQEEIDGKDRITALIVTRDMGGVTHGAEEQKLGIKASSTTEIHFENTKVPVENVLSKPGDGFKVAMNILNQGRLGLAGGALGTHKKVLTQSIQYAKNRKAFGKSISEFGIIADYISEMAADAYALESIVYLTTDMVDKGDIDYSVEAAICKVFGTEACWKALNNAMQIHGGNGYMKDYGLERELRDGRIGIIFEGTNEILRLFISLTGLKGLAGDYKQVNKEVRDLQKRNFENISDALDKIGVISQFAYSQIKTSLIPGSVEGFHPALEKESEALSDAVRMLANNAGRIIRTYKDKLVNEQVQLARMADIAIDTYIMAATISRIHSVLEKNGGVEKNKDELALAQLVVNKAKDRVAKSFADAKSNNDKDVLKVAEMLCEKEAYPFDLHDINISRG